jgi:hypothetical protein
MVQPGSDARLFDLAFLRFQSLKAQQVPCQVANGGKGRVFPGKVRQDLLQRACGMPQLLQQTLQQLS